MPLFVPVINVITGCLSSDVLFVRAMYSSFMFGTDYYV
jgi:hypothetical protein